MTTPASATGVSALALSRAAGSIVVASVALFLARPLCAQIVVGPNVQVSHANADRPHYEVVIAADGHNADRLIACAITASLPEYRHKTMVYFSADRGRTWTPTLEVAPGWTTSRDPACTYGSDGSAYFTGFAFGPVQQGNRYVNWWENFLYRSKDGGAHWLPRTAVVGMDRPFVTVDNTSSKYRGRVYVHGTGGTKLSGENHRRNGLTLEASVDSGATFRSPATLLSGGRNYVLGPGNSVVLEDGTLVWVYSEIKEFWTDAGEGQVPDNHGAVSNAWLKVVFSRDGGTSLSDPVTVTDDYMQWPPSTVGGMPAIALDQSDGPYRGRLYVAWPDIRSGRSEVLLSYSANSGRTWSRPIAVNDDRARPERGMGPDDFLPMVVVNRSGVVGVSWYDRRDNPDDMGWYVRMSASLDGGESFLPSVRVSEAPFAQHFDRPTPLEPGEDWVQESAGDEKSGSSGSTVKGVLNLMPFFFNSGDTAGLIDDAEGTFHPLWIDNRTGVPQVWTAAVEVSGKPVLNGAPDLARLLDVTRRVLLSFRSPQYDPGTGQVSVDAILTNTSPDTVRAPLKMKLVGLNSQLGDIEALNADNKVRSLGAIWDLSHGLTNGRLVPGATSAPVRLEFRLFGVTAFHPRDAAYARLLIVGLNGRVFGNLAARPDGR